jgi:hypothetical protein
VSRPPAPPRNNPTSQKKHKRFDPHRAVGTLVIYGLALHSAVLFVYWLGASLVHELGF